MPSEFQRSPEENLKEGLYLLGLPKSKSITNATTLMSWIKDKKEHSVLFWRA